jgi:hypothetical protein
MWGSCLFWFSEEEKKIKREKTEKNGEDWKKKKVKEKNREKRGGLKANFI